ncbi:MAG: CoB--CoM heterodisulfide reductase iron-sulfur subunit B family protein [Clostridia bacterium]|nr:CoB--CoM heterodisulfide reductase iron-sulfur subunit B family protein [Clostridia bacterium]
MKATYFPGCTLRTKAKDLDVWARKCAEVLGITLEEPADWQCCGGVFSMANDEIASKLAAVRALKAARDASQPLVTVCSACHNVLKQTNHAMQTDVVFASRVNNYMADEAPYAGETQVLHYLELLRDTVGFDELAKKVVKPLTGKKIAPYYGCLLLRPSKVMQMDDPENPQIMEDFLRAIGAEPVFFGRRNECCGGYLSLEDAAAAKKNSTLVMDSAAGNGAELMVTACPLCRYNLIKNGSGAMPVVYFTELLAEALGVKEEIAND